MLVHLHLSGNNEVHEPVPLNFAYQFFSDSHLEDFVHNSGENDVAQ